VLLLRRLLACLLTVLVLLETGGVARAIAGADIACCCGHHSAARKCGCKSCPIVKRRAPRELIGDQLDSARDCQGGSSDQALVLQVTALVVVAAPLLAPRPIRAPLGLALVIPEGRRTGADRPPP